MKPLFFGEAEHRLYGVYHPPAKGGRHAVLLCYPGMQEYNSAHWVFRRLATTLAREGHHVLRFDYFGTGDSDGESDLATPQSAVADVLTAARELRDLSRVGDAPSQTARIMRFGPLGKINAPAVYDRARLGSIAQSGKN